MEKQSIIRFCMLGHPEKLQRILKVVSPALFICTGSHSRELMSGILLNLIQVLTIPEVKTFYFNLKVFRFGAFS